jgi:dienelactone hydrolase
MQNAVRDAEPASDKLPLILFFHGGYAHRRYSTELCTHLASHGYLVAAPDFTGNTLADQLHDGQLKPGEAPRLVNATQSATDRPLDAALVIDRLLEGAAPGLSELIDPEQIGTCGQSFGGWTTVAFNSKDKRPKASFPIVPPWGKGPSRSETLSALVRLDDWGRDVPTFVLAAELDSAVKIEGVRELYRDLKVSKRLAVLRRSGHMHFGDDAEAAYEEFRAACAANDFPVAEAEASSIDFRAIAAASPPFSELCPAAHGQAVVRSLCVSHMDAHLKRRPEARAFLNQDLADLFAVRGIDLEVSSSS